MILVTHLTAAVVYTDRARLTRRGKVELSAGLHQLEIEDLSVRLQPDSARVSALGSTRARLLGMKTQITYYEETPAEMVRDLEAQVEAAQDELSGLTAEVDAITRQQTQLDRLARNSKVFARALASGRLTMDDQMALYDRLRQRASELDAEIRRIEQRKRQAERRLELLVQQLEQSRSLAPRRRYTALVDVEILQPGELIVELSYVVDGARWTPLYDLRLNEDGEKPVLELGYLAQVTQDSGEDWQNIHLTLSTARPVLAAAVPELDPWYLRPVTGPRPLAAPMAVPANAARMKQADAMSFSAAGATAEEPLPAEEALAAVETHGSVVTYVIPGAASIPPDGGEHRVVIARYPLTPVMDYVSAPSMVPAAYRRAKLVNSSSYTLLPGKANLFAGDEFLGATRLEMTAPGGEIELYLGVEDRIKVERELVRREVEKTLIGGRRRLHYGYEIKLENLLPTNIEVVLRERYPVGRHEEIKVRLENSEPQPSEQDELGRLVWTINLASREKFALRFNFQVEYPQSMELIGLPDGVWPRGPDPS